MDMVEGEATGGRLRDCEFFLFTDNSTAESCFYRGNSKSRNLHALVLKLRTLEMTDGMTIHVVHISGKRMISQGTDGCSRGSLMEGVMAGADMLTFVDLARGGVDRHPELLDWIRTWTQSPLLVPLTPEGWFEEGHGITGGEMDSRGVWIPRHCTKGRIYLWSPAPAIADAALEELLKSRHKRMDLTHIVVIPRLMTPRWRRLFNKVCDFTFVVSPGAAFWPSHMYEPNLDAMLGKPPLTIRSHRRETLAALRNADSIGKTPAYHPRGPFPVGDYVGMSLAVDMLVKSLVAKGRILDHVQFSTLRKMRSNYTKNWESSPHGVMEGAAFANGKYRVRQT